MAEYIKRKCRDCFNLAACAEWIRNGSSLYSDFSYSVADCPYYVSSADVVEVKHGRWIEKRERDTFRGYVHYYQCSQCGRVENHKELYCHCGARMDGGD